MPMARMKQTDNQFSFDESWMSSASLETIHEKWAGSSDTMKVQFRAKYKNAERMWSSIAETRLIAMHQNKGKTIARCLKDRTDYAKNGEKTDHGKETKWRHHRVSDQAVFQTTLSGILVTRYFLFHHCSKLSLWLRKRVASVQIYDYTDTNSIVFTPIGGRRNGLPHQYGNV